MANKKVRVGQTFYFVPVMIDALHPPHNVEVGDFNEELEEGFVQFIHAADFTTDDVNGDPELKDRLHKEWQESA